MAKAAEQQKPTAPPPPPADGNPPPPPPPPTSSPSPPKNIDNNNPSPEFTGSYWYPDRVGDMDEVSYGYRKTFGRRWVSPIFIPITLVLLVYTGFRSTLVESIIEGVLAEIATQRDIGHQIFPLLFFCSGCVALVFFVIFYWIYKKNPVYLIDFTTFQGNPEEMGTCSERFLEKSRRSGWFNEEALQFQEKLLKRNGLGQETLLPLACQVTPPDLSMARAREECEMVFTGAIDEIFAKSGLCPKDINILIVNCSLFSPTPSITSMIINKYKMNTNIRSYNLSGMGCSAGIIAIDLAKDLLSRVHRNSNCLIFSHENITQNWYTGNQKSMLITNTLFRVGGAAILLSNKPSLRNRAKYRLLTTVRVHKGADDASYNAIFQMEDSERNKGVKLSRDLVKVVGHALKSNLTILGPQVLPWSEQIKFFIILCLRTISSDFRKKNPPYTPNFKKAFQHFCIHAGGRGIIDGLEENLQLTPEDTTPSRATLYRWGNTSSSSVWYELRYIERVGKIKAGHKIWQIAFGSGIKVNSAVWVAL